MVDQSGDRHNAPTRTTTLAPFLQVLALTHSATLRTTDDLFLFWGESGRQRDDAATAGSAGSGWRKAVLKATRPITAKELNGMAMAQT